MKKLIDEFVQSIKQQTPPETNVVDMLLNIVPMSKEAIYRRLRGEIAFTFEEVVKISEKLNISIDSLIESARKESENIEETSSTNINNTIEEYYQSLDEVTNLLRIIKTKSNPTVFVSSSSFLPFPYVMKYKTMSKLYAFRRMYQFDCQFVDPNIGDFKSSPSKLLIENAFAKIVSEIATNFICLPELFQPFIRDIKFFGRIDILPNEEIINIKKEMLCLLDDLERDVTRGKNEKGSPFLLYICNLNFDFTCIYFQSNELQAVSTPLLGARFQTFKNPRICKEIKTRTANLIKNSTLISVSGEKQRFEFFRKQRELVYEI